MCNKHIGFYASWAEVITMSICMSCPEIGCLQNDPKWILDNKRLQSI
jgi:hypothetical protein